MFSPKTLKIVIFVLLLDIWTFNPQKIQGEVMQFFIQNVPLLLNPLNILIY